MATIKIEIDTDAEIHQLAGSQMAKLVPKPIIVFSSIHINGDLRQAFISGANNQTPVWDDGLDYDDLANEMQPYDKSDFVIATAGGSILFEAAKSTLKSARFVSVLGTSPTSNVGNCFGGVNLQSLDANSKRVDYLVSNGCTRANIGLFCNPKSAMNQAEEKNWNSIPGVFHPPAHGGNTGNKNDSTHYDKDLAALDPKIHTLIISADPFFQDTKEELIKALNHWLKADSKRRVCYPLEDYKNVSGTPPTNKKSYWYGPALKEVYNLLGNSAAAALTATSPLPFAKTTDTWGVF